MADPIEFKTERLFLRQWIPEDRVPFAELNADSRVMELFPSLLTRIESDLIADRLESFIRERDTEPHRDVIDTCRKPDWIDTSN